MDWHSQVPTFPSTSLAALSEFSLLTLITETLNVPATPSSILGWLLSSIPNVYFSLFHKLCCHNIVESHIYFSSMADPFGIFILLSLPRCLMVFHLFSYSNQSPTTPPKKKSYLSHFCAQSLEPAGFQSLSHHSHQLHPQTMGLYPHFSLITPFFPFPPALSKVEQSTPYLELPPACLLQSLPLQSIFF